MSLLKTPTWSPCCWNRCHVHQWKSLYGFHAHSQFHRLFCHYRRTLGRWGILVWYRSKVILLKYFRVITLPNAFATVTFNWQLITLYSVFAFGGFWLVCWIFYSNTFVVMSAASIWYYQQDSPLCTSMYRLFRYHAGSLAFTSLLFGILFIFRLIAKFFHLRNE